MMRLDGIRNIRIGKEAPIYPLLFGMLAIQFAAPLNWEALQSVGTLLIFGASILALVFSKKRWNGYLLLLAALAASVILSMAFSFTFSYRSIVVALCFLEIPLFMQAYTETERESVRKAIYYCFICLSLYYLLLSFTSVSHAYATKYGTVWMEYLTLGYDNPNETAIHLFSCLIVLLSGSFAFERRWSRVLITADAVMVSVLLTLTLSRTGIIMGAFLWISVWWFRKRRIPTAVRVVSFVVPVAFLLATLALENASIDWIVLGESIRTGRYDVYEKVLQGMSGIRFFVGDYTFEFQNLHNGFWALFATLGVVGVIPFLWFFYAKLRETHRRVGETPTRKAALLGLLCILIYTSTEAAFLVTGSVYAAEVVSVYLLALPSTKPAAPSEEVPTA